MTDPPKKPPGNRVQVHVPGDIEPIYTNFAVITNSPSEIVIDFAQIMPQKKQANVKTRIVMTALNAKLVHRALTEHIARFESQYGEIIVPEGRSLADHLFGSSSPSEDIDE
ncbi:MAG: DUF3467 domain-containing protein [Anaerolineales bacterium]|nr:DUF3467 domain-containing protein [Anaerolineales bacterium]